MPEEKGKILIVEDQAIVSTNIQILLKHKGYTIADVAVTGEKAIELIEKNVPDLVLMDISLPGIYDGIETADIIASRWNIPIVYLSAHTDQATLERAKNTAPYAYLTKDISLKEQLPLMVEFVLYKHKILLEKQETEMALRDSEEKFRSIASSAKDAIIFLDNEGKITFWNDAARHIFGWGEQDVLGLELYNVISPPHYRDYYKKGFTDYAISGKGDFIGRTIELEAIKKSNYVFPIELSLSSVMIKGKWCACGIMRDITLRKTTEDELERLIEEIQISREVIEQHANELINLNHKLIESEERLQELNASKDKFFSIISHDLKNPLQGLVGYSEVLARDIDNLTMEDIKEIVGDINTSAQNIFKLLENLLEWSRIQRGIITFQPSEVNLQQIASINADLQMMNAARKEIEIIVDVPEDVVLFADANMVNTIIRNLLSNAVKFTRQGGRIIISSKPVNENYVEIHVTDNGVGMSKEVCEELFRIDKQHTTLGTANEKGTGLGLVLCRELAEKNNGAIRVESEPGEGSSFIVTIPLYINQ